MKIKCGVFLALLLTMESALALDFMPVMPEGQTCQITGSQNEVAYGVIRRDQFLAQNMPERRLRITVNCRYPQPLSLKINGLSSNKDFAWGNAGQIRLSIANATLDNMPVAILSSGDQMRAESNEKEILPGQDIAPGVKGKQASGKVFSFDLTLRPGINKNTASIAEQQLLDATINILLN